MYQPCVCAAAGQAQSGPGEIFLSPGGFPSHAAALPVAFEPVTSVARPTQLLNLLLPAAVSVSAAAPVLRSAAHSGAKQCTQTHMLKCNVFCCLKHFCLFVSYMDQLGRGEATKQMYSNVQTGDK